jgi:hypothetical protein
VTALADRPVVGADDVGPSRRVIRQKLQELDKIRSLLEQARRQKAAARIQELHNEVTPRIREMKELLE